MSIRSWPDRCRSLMAGHVLVAGAIGSRRALWVCAMASTSLLAGPRTWLASRTVWVERLSGGLQACGGARRSVDALAAGCPALHTLDLSGCVGVRRRGRDHLRGRLPRLTTFVVHT